MCWVGAWLLGKRRCTLRLNSGCELEGETFRGQHGRDKDAVGKGFPWAELPEVLLEPISELLGGHQVWHTWRVNHGAKPDHFRALRRACGRVARGSAAALLRADLASAMDRVKEDGERDRAEARRDFLMNALRVLSDRERFPSLTAVRVCCWDAAGVRAVGQAFDVERGSAISVDLVLDSPPAPVRQAADGATDDAGPGVVASPAESWPLDPPVRCVYSLAVGASREVSDQALGGIIASFPGLCELDLRRCCHLETLASLLPWLDDAGSSPQSPCLPRWLWLDGCWRISEEAMDWLAKRHGAGTCHVDLFRNGGAPWSSGRNVEVVILVQQYAGNWVSASLISGPMWQPGSPEPRFNILVHETEDFSNAVGFSGRIAFRIRRRHLRERRRRLEQGGSGGGAAAADGRAGP